MNFAQQQTNSTRASGFAIVVLIHVVLVWGISSGLARKAIEKVVGPIETKVIEEVKKAPPPPENLPPPPPQLKAPPPPFVPPPEIQITAPVVQAPTITQTTTAPPPRTEIRPVQAPVQVAPPPPRPAGPVKAGVACTKLVTPEVPGVNWSGEASFNVKGTVKNGKVVAIEVLSSQMRGGNDRRTQRALISSIEAAMSGYECPGAEFQIQQEFVFKID